MKTISFVIVSLFLSQLSYVQNNIEPCEIELTLNELIKTPIQKDCFNISNDSEFIVIAFKIKVPGQPSVTVSGNKLNRLAILNLKKRKPKSSVQIFDIKLKDKTIVVPQHIIITLVEN